MVKDRRFGAQFHRPTARQLVDTIVRADELGVSSVWLTSRPDPVTAFAAAATLTRNVKMGTAIVPTFPRHPLVLAHQLEVVDAVAPGRMTIGLGPSHQPLVTAEFGLSFERPLEHLREYVAVLRMALEGQRVEFEGKRLNVHTEPRNRVPMPIMISALRPLSFRLAGEVADGAIPWICPAPYLKKVALPALQEGAAATGRPSPPMLAHAFIAVSDNADEALGAVRQRIEFYPRLPSYRAMFLAAGYPEAEQGEWSNRMLDAVVIRGVEREVEAGLRSFMDESGADAMIASIVPADKDEQASIERGLNLLASM